MLRPCDSQGVEVFEERLDVRLGEFVNRDLFVGCLLDDPVLDVGQIHHLGYLIFVLDEDTAQQILEEETSEVPNVGVVVDRRPAGIHPHLAGSQRRECLSLAGHRVVQAERCHAISLSSTTACAAKASPRPIAPTWSVVVAFSPAAAGSTPSASARLFRICSRYGASRGTWASSVTSTFSTAHLARRQLSVTSRSRSRLRASLYFGSSSGNRVPMSPMPAAPQSASIRAWQTTSASLWPCNPMSQGSSTPPSTSRRPTTNR